MALSKMGGGIIEIAGKMSGNIYKRDASGQHTQSFPRIIHRQPSATQRSRRNAWRTCNVYWLETITEQNRILWSQYATLHPTTNKQGLSVTLNAYQMFLSLNIIRVYNEQAILPSPPD